MPYAPVDVGYRSLERRATPPCVLGNAPLGNFEMILMFLKNIRLIKKNIRTFVDKDTVDCLQTIGVCHQSTVSLSTSVRHHFFKPYLCTSTIRVGANSLFRISTCSTTFAANSSNARPVIVFSFRATGAPLSPPSQILCTIGI
jgi:hypothetical protein